MVMIKVMNVINGAKTKEQFNYINCEFYQYNKRMFCTKEIQK